jgi:hypothetical protein
MNDKYGETKKSTGSGVADPTSVQLEAGDEGGSVKVNQETMGMRIYCLLYDSDMHRFL